MLVTILVGVGALVVGYVAGTVFPITKVTGKADNLFK